MTHQDGAAASGTGHGNSNTLNPQMPDADSPASGTEGSRQTGFDARAFGDDGGAAPASGTESSNQPGYATAMAELEEILAELEGDDPDIDALAERVARAATLIEVCRERIANASIQVERVVAALDSDEPT